MPIDLSPARLKTWTTASLVIWLARYGTGDNVARDAASAIAAELNARVPPRVMPTSPAANTEGT